MVSPLTSISASPRRILVMIALNFLSICSSMSNIGFSLNSNQPNLEFIDNLLSLKGPNYNIDIKDGNFTNMLFSTLEKAKGVLSTYSDPNNKNEIIDI